MEVVMCRGCGTFVRAVAVDGGLTPTRDACPKCDGTEFRDVHADRLVGTRDG